VFYFYKKPCHCLKFILEAVANKTKGCHLLSL
jgi:hypothetical protein